MNEPKVKTISASETVSFEMPPVTGAEQPIVAPRTETPGETVTDASGRKFEPGKHKTNADGTPFRNKRGMYMPIGGRSGPKDRETRVTEHAPVASYIPEKVPDFAPNPNGNPNGNAAESGAGNGTVADTASGNGNGNAGEKKPKGAVSSETVADVIAKAAYVATGVATGEHSEAKPPPDLHENIKDVVGAQIDDGSGKSSIGGLTALAVVGVAYLVHVLSQPKTAEKFRVWWNETETPPPPPRVCDSQIGKANRSRFGTSPPPGGPLFRSTLNRHFPIFPDKTRTLN